MIQMQSMLTVADNSGARRLMCIKVSGGSRRRYARVGDLIRVSVKGRYQSKGEKEDVLKAVVRTEQGVRRQDGSLIRFDNNAAVLVNNSGDPLGTDLWTGDTELESDIWLFTSA